MSTNEPARPAGLWPALQVDEVVTCRVDDLATSSRGVEDRGLHGVEVFMNDLKARTQPLWSTDTERDELLATLRSANVRRIHSSYWASPTAFVAGVNFGELVRRFDGVDRVRKYFGDLTGRHMFTRWRQEYEAAAAIGADAFVFHLIDYMPVDGAWAFSVTRETVLDAMIVLTDRLLRELEEFELITEESPLIELENAGWGLEFGAQTADDFSRVFGSAHDPLNRLRLGWDLNHLLHATGVEDGNAVFLLPAEEISPAMAKIQHEAAGDLAALSHMWITENILDPRLIDRVSALHLSDCPAKEAEYFRNGLLEEGHRIAGDWEERQAEGLRVVLEHYDNHVVLGRGVLDPAAIRHLIKQIADRQPLTVLHELKNESDVWAALDQQREALWK